MAEFFTWVGEASPWLWLALGIALMALEILAPSFVMVWPGLAALAMALLTWLMPGISGQALVAIFAVLAVGLLVAGRMVLANFEKSEAPSGLNTRGKNLVGRQAKVVSVSGSGGKIEIDGVEWPATWDEGSTPETGQWVSITAATGVNLSAATIKT